jgi:NAD(P)-dependent dehydrogenase (short-subunit alcohol dehydrogenase family)
MADLQLAGRSCVVTGATRGIGRAITALLLTEGAQVLAVGRRTESCAKLAADLAEHEPRLTVMAQDMRQDQAGETVVACARNTLSGIDVLINVAAAFEYRRVDELTRADWSGLMDLKLMGYASITNAALPDLRRSKGSVTNIAGVAGVVATPDAPHVAAVNAAIISMTISYAAQLAPDGVRVNVVSPGVTNTDRFATRAAQLATHLDGGITAARAALAERIPMGYPADPDEIALAVVTIAAPRMRSITGAHLIIDGGETLGRRRSGQ